MILPLATQAERKNGVACKKTCICLLFVVFNLKCLVQSRFTFGILNKLPFGKSVAPYRQNQTSMQVSSLPDSGSFLGKATVTVISKLRFYC